MMKRNQPLILSEYLITTLLEMPDEVSKDLLSHHKNYDESFPISYIDYTTKDDIVTFIPSHKIDELEYPWGNKNRQEIKFGRLISKITKRFKADDIENFVNLYKAKMSISDKLKNFTIIEGNDIVEYYNEINHAPGGGTLSKSCLRHNFCKNYFEMYKHNTNKCKMLILFNNDMLVLGRALIWYLDEPKDLILLERIYTVQDSITQLFILYAKKQGWAYKATQSHSEENVIINNEKCYINMKINLSHHKHEHYPYIDTLQYYHLKDNYITNNTHQYKKDPYLVKLRDNYGRYRDNEYFTWDNIDKKYINYKLISHCRIDGIYTHKKNTIYLPHLDSYFPIKNMIKCVDGGYHHKKDVIFSKNLNGYIYKKYSIKVNVDLNNNQDYYHCKDTNKLFELYIGDDQYYTMNTIKDIEHNKSKNLPPYDGIFSGMEKELYNHIIHNFKRK